jgi:MFS family permease
MSGASGANQYRLLRERRFLPFFVTQACGAFNDNLLKNVLVILVTYQAARWSSLRPELLTNIAAGVFILPFVVLSGIAGQIGERYDKALILKCVKALEIGIMLVAGVGFLNHWVILLLAALFLMGTHSTFFAPAKYGLLPQVLSATELIGGNAMLETGTFLAILLGTMAAGLLAGHANTAWIAATLLLVAFIGFFTSLGIPRLAAVAPGQRLDWNPWSSSICARRVNHARCCCRSWACPGSGSSAPSSSPSCPCTAMKCCAATNRWSPRPSSCFRSVSASARCCANGSPAGRWKSDWSLSGRSA